MIVRNGVPLVLPLGVVNGPAVDWRRIDTLKRRVVLERKQSRGRSNQPGWAELCEREWDVNSNGEKKREVVVVPLENLGVGHPSRRRIDGRVPLEHEANDAGVLQEDVQSVVVVAHRALPTAHLFHRRYEMYRERLHTTRANAPASAKQWFGLKF